MDADAGWETMLIPPDYERVPSAGVAVGYPDAGKKTMPIPPDCKHVPGSGITAGVTDTGWETMPIPPDYTRILGACYHAHVFGRRFLSSSERSRQLAPLDPEFHDNHEFWRWIVEAGMDASEGGLSAPMYRLVARLPCHTLTSGASKHAVGGFCLET